MPYPDREARLMEVGFVGGLRIESDFALRGLVDERLLDAALGRVVVSRVSSEELVQRAQADPASIALEPGQPGSFLVTSINEVLVAPAVGAAVRSILSYLFGPCLGVIAYRNGLLPLHASAVATAGGCVGFSGHSGAGKSTMVAALSQRGYSIHSDDVCMLGGADNERAQVWPGVRWIRLTEQSVQALDYARGLPDIGGKKHTLGLDPVVKAGGARHLRAVYVLERTTTGEPASVTRLQGSRAAERIIANMYRPALAHRLGAWPKVVIGCAGVANQVPVFLFRRAFEFDRMAESLDLLEAHMAALEDLRQPA
jgi:hypothetical protein